ACVLGKISGVSREIVDDPMYPDALRRLRIRCVGVVEDKREALSALRRTPERKRRRSIAAFAGVFRWNLAAGLEGRRRERESHGSASRINDEPSLENKEA